MDFVFVGGIVLLVLLGPWVLVWRISSRRKRERDEDNERWQELSSRTYTLEQTVRTLQAQRPGSAAEEVTPKTSERHGSTSYVPTFTSPSVVPPPVPPVVEPTPEPSPSVRIAENWITQKADESATTSPVPPTPPTVGPVFPSNFATGINLSIADRLKSSLDIEEMLGTNWLNKLGIVILVLGVAFFLAYQLKTLGPAGKVLVGFMTSGVMLGTGIWFDRKERYRILARAGIGGGWALLFFTTYAM